MKVNGWTILAALAIACTILFARWHTGSNWVFLCVFAFLFLRRQYAEGEMVCSNCQHKVDVVVMEKFTPVVTVLCIIICGFTTLAIYLTNCDFATAGLALLFILEKDFLPYTLCPGCGKSIRVLPPELE